MKTAILPLLAVLGWLGVQPAAAGEAVVLFDGKTFAGWEGDTQRTWKIEDGALVGGSLETRVPRNEFLTTVRRYTNFVLTLEVKLEGTEGFVNGGVQVRSERLKDPAHEMCGYQADIGEGWWGALYDESRRNKVLVKAEDAAVVKALRPQDWNTYVIRCEGPRIRTWLNGVAMIDYTEADASLPQQGLIGLQIHGDAKARIAFRNLRLEEL